MSALVIYRMGLSPRVWGNRAGLEQAAAQSRSIPTCVGEPTGAGQIVPYPQVYPHVCGGTIETSQVVSTSQGLSPRVWGNPDSINEAQAGSGSIPTCVGEPISCPGIRGSVGVYPHVCGGTLYLLPRYRGCWGLSPRVWGNLYLLPRHPGLLGSIPTCVGEPN